MDGFLGICLVVLTLMALYAAAKSVFTVCVYILLPTLDRREVNRGLNGKAFYLLSVTFQEN